MDRVEFAFWDPGANLPPNGWTDAWSGNRPPKLVRIRIVFSTPLGLRWPDIAAATERMPRMN